MILYRSLINKFIEYSNSVKNLQALLYAKNYSGDYIFKDKIIEYILNSDQIDVNHNLIEYLQNILLSREKEYEMIKTQFMSLKNAGQLAVLIGYQYESHISYLLKILEDSYYSVFYIPKKKGGFRTISAPDRNLIQIQARLNSILNKIHVPKPASHGFLNNRSIVTNAKAHIGKKNVFNIDIKNFFPSINFGRTRGLFLAKPFHLPDNVSTIIARICCHENALPQGAPTSPIISNMICQRLDQKLMIISKKYLCTYTRYADDLTFSNTKNKFPEELLPDVRKVIEEEGFFLNEEKIRLQNKYFRQEVTGLTVNEKTNIKRKYIKNVRAILHCWETKGIYEATRIYGLKYSRYRLIGIPDFKSSIRGKIEYIGMVRGKNDKIYLEYLYQFDKLNLSKK